MEGFLSVVSTITSLESRASLQEDILNDIDQLDKVERHTSRYKELIMNKTNDKPFRIDSDRLELLTPAERIEIRKNNQSKPCMQDQPKNPQRLFFLQTLNTLFNNNIEKSTEESFLNLVIQWLEIFLLHFELGYYEESEFLEVLRSVRASLKQLNGINNRMFVEFLYDYVLRFVKQSLFYLVDKIYQDVNCNHSKAAKVFQSLADADFDMNITVEAGMNFGEVLEFYKKVSKQKYTAAEEEINLVQELYFDNCYGPNELKNNIIVNWVLMERDLILKEYFFNIRDTLLIPEHMNNYIANKGLNNVGVTKLSKIRENLSNCIVMETENNANRAGASPSGLLNFGLTFAALDNKEQNENSKNVKEENRQLFDSPPQDNLGGTAELSPFAGLNMGQTEHIPKPPEGQSTVNVSETEALLKEINIVLNTLSSDDPTNRNMKNSKSLLASASQQQFYFGIEVGPIIKGICVAILNQQSKGEAGWLAQEPVLKQELMKAILNDKIIMSCFSSTRLLALIGMMPREALEVLKETRTPDTFSPLFGRLIEQFLSWIYEETIETFVTEQTAKHDNVKTRQDFLTSAEAVLIFFDKVVKDKRRVTPESIEYEIAYLDFLSFFITRTQMMERFDEWRSLGEIENRFLLQLLSSLELATERFYLIEKSAQFKTIYHQLLSCLQKFSSGIKDDIEDSIDEAAAILVDANTVIFKGLDVSNTKFTMLLPANFPTFVEQASGDAKLSDPKFFAIYLRVVKLQINLIYSKEESCIDGEKTVGSLEAQDQLNLFLFNLKIISSRVCVESLKYEENLQMRELCGLVLCQGIYFFRKLSLVDPQLAKTKLSREVMVFTHLGLSHLMKEHNIYEPQIEIRNMVDQPSRVVTEILDSLIRAQRGLNIKNSMTEDFRRVSIFHDKTNLRSIYQATRFSSKFPKEKSMNTYYKYIFQGQSDIEVDPREIYSGLARSFIKIFNKVSIGSRGGLKFKKIDNSIKETFEHLFPTKIANLIKHQGNLTNVEEFIRHMRTSYFYNDVYSRAMVLFQKLTDELRELKIYIHNEACKNRMIVSFFRGSIWNQSYPFIQSLYQILFGLNHTLLAGIFHNNRWGILMSKFILTQGLVQNLCQDNYEEFRRLHLAHQYSDPNDHIHLEEADDLRILETTKPSFIVSICCRLQKILEGMGCENKYNIVSILNQPMVSSSMSLLTLWLNFLDRILPEDKDLWQYLLYKLFSRYLLKILFHHEEIHNLEILHFKSAISNLLFHITMDRDVLSNFLKYGYDQRFVYDYIIMTTKMHVWTILNENQGLFGIRQRNSNEADQRWDKKAFAAFLGGFAESETSKFRLYNEHDFSERPLDDEIIKMNICVFGGAVKGYRPTSFNRAVFDKVEDMDLDNMINCYKKSDNRDLGFQYIHSLVKFMNAIEFGLGFRLWSNKKETARVFFEVERGKLPKSKVYELKIVYLLSMISKQIEVLDANGESVIITFRKYPGVYTIENLNPLLLVEVFDIEDYKRDICRAIPELFVKANIQYSIMEKSGFMYRTINNDALDKYPVFLWFLSLILNGLVLFGYENPKYLYNTHKYRTNFYKLAIYILAYVIMGISFILSCFWLYTRYLVISFSSKIAKTRSKKDSQVFASNTTSSLEKRGPLQFIFENPYFKLLMGLLLQEAAMSLFLHMVWAALGLFVHPLYYSFGILMFGFFNETTRNLLKAITTNGGEIILTLVLLLMVAYIFGLLQFFYFYDQFKDDTFGASSPCDTLYNCFMNVLNYGVRSGGGIGEQLNYVAEQDPQFYLKFSTDLGFFFFINIIALNIVFGIIIDTFGQLRDEEYVREEFLNNSCLVCGMQKTDFESAGVNFFYHTNMEHNFEDYISFMIRLNINEANLTHDIDFTIFELVKRLNISWFPGSDTIFLRHAKRELDVAKEEQKKIGEKVLQMEEKAESIISLLERLSEKKNVKVGNQVFKFTRSIPQRKHSTLVMKGEEHSSSEDLTDHAKVKLLDVSEQ